MKTLLFGGGGYIGSSIYADIRIGRKEVELTDFQSVLNLLKKYRPTRIISAAAKHGSFKEMQSNHRAYLRENLLIDSNILEAAARNDIEDVTILSSISGLPESNKALNEQMISKGRISESNFGYNCSKFSSIQLVKSYQLDGFSNYKCYLLGNIYGYNEHFVRNTNVVAVLTKLMYSALKEGSNLKLYGNGLDARCFTHLNDVRNIVTKLSGIRKDFAEPLIISNSSFNTIEEIANEIAESMNFRNEIIFQDVDDATYTVKKVDNSKLLSTIGGYEFLDLKSGINLTVQQFLQNQALSI